MADSAMFLSCYAYWPVSSGKADIESLQLVDKTLCGTEPVLQLDLLRQLADDVLE